MNKKEIAIKGVKIGLVVSLAFVSLFSLVSTNMNVIDLRNFLMQAVCNNNNNITGNSLL